MPRDREITPEDALLLASFDQWRELRGHGEVTATELLRREPARVDREQSVELAELLPGRTEDSLQRFLRLTALRP